MREEWAIVLQRALSAELPRGWREAAPWGYPQQSELALIAGVFAAQVPQATAEQVASAFMMARPGRMLDDLADLAALTDDDVASALGDQWGASTVLGVPRRRAAVIREAAERLADAGIRSAREYRDAVMASGEDVDGRLRAVRGLGAVTSESISTMMQAEHRAGPDTVAYVLVTLGPDAGDLREPEVMALLRATARRLTVEPRVLLHALWSHLEAVADEREGAAAL